MKDCDNFHILAQNIDCGYSLEPPQCAAFHMGLFCLLTWFSSKNEIKKKNTLGAPKNLTGLKQNNKDEKVHSSYRAYN